MPLFEGRESGRNGFFPMSFLPSWGRSEGVGGKEKGNGGRTLHGMPPSFLSRAEAEIPEPQSRRDRKSFIPPPSFFYGQLMMPSDQRQAPQVGVSLP